MMGVVRLFWDAYRAFLADDGSAMAGYIAFSALLGLFPFLILATNLTAYTLGPGGAEAAVAALFDFAPPHLAQTIEPILLDVLSGAGGGLLTLSAIAALWFSSNAVEAIRTAFDRAYDDAEPRGAVAGRLISILVVLIGVVVAMTLGTTIVLAPLAFGVIEAWFEIRVPGWAGAVRYGIGMGTYAMFLVFLHRVLPGHRLPLRALWAGVAVTTVIWIIAATGFSIYLGITPTYATTYGTLAGVVISLVFFYISGMAVIFGAEINAVRNGKGRR